MGTLVLINTYCFVWIPGQDDGEVPQINRDLLDDLLGKAPSLEHHLIVGAGHQAPQGNDGRLSVLPSFVLAGKPLSHLLPLQQGRQLVEVAAEMRDVVQRYAELWRKMIVS